MGVERISAKLTISILFCKRDSKKSPGGNSALSRKIYGLHSRDHITERNIMPDLEWNVDYHTRQIAEIIYSNSDLLSKPVYEMTYTDTYQLLSNLRQIEAQNALLISELRVYQQSAPK